MIRPAAALLALTVAGLCLSVPAAGFAEGRVYEDAESVEPLPVGARVPEAPVRSIDGVVTDLASVTAEQGTLLVFYRGGW